MSSSTLLKLHDFHRQLHTLAHGAAQNFSAFVTTEIAAYSQSFHRSIPPAFETIGEEEILGTLPDSRFLLFGDFHTLKQTQRSFLRLLSSVFGRFPTRPIVVALEIFNAEDQTHIEQYQAGSISEEVFLKRIDYSNKWGFPWENYRPIVQFCLQQKIPIIGINHQFDSPNRLARRDVFAADILNRWAEVEADAFCFCLIGEYHLADRHLLAQLNPDFRAIRVIANVDEFALQTLAHPMLKDNDYLRLGKDFYCTLNTAPWVKWQSLVIWEELHASGDQNAPPEEFDLYTEQHYDFDYQLLHILKALNSFLKLELSSSDLTHFDLYFKPDRSTLNYLKSKLDLGKHELLAAEKSLASGSFHYFSPARAILLQDISIDSFAAAAGHVLYDILHPEEIPSSFSQRVERQVCSALSRLLMNPRHCRDSADASPGRMHETAYQILTRMREYGDDLQYLDSPFLLEEDRQCCFELSRELGEQMAQEIFRNVWLLSEADFLPLVQQLFRGGLATQRQLLTPPRSHGSAQRNAS